MAKIAYNSLSITPTTGTFRSWLLQTNRIIEDMGTSVVTAATTTIGNDVALTGSTNGHVVIYGSAGANVLFALDSLRGGNNSVGGTLNIISNVAIAANVSSYSNESQTTTFIGDTVSFDTNTVTGNANISLNGTVTINNDVTIIGNTDITSNTIVGGYLDGTNTTTSNARIGHDGFSVNKVLQKNSFGINSITFSGGTGYAPGEVITITGLGSGAVATARVTTVSGSGAVTGSLLISEGNNFTSGESQSYSSNGSGVGVSATVTKTNANTISIVAGANAAMNVAHLNISNTAIFPNTISLIASSVSTNTLIVNANATVHESFFANGNTVFSGAVSNISSNTVFLGNPSGNVAFNGLVSTSINPKTNNVDLGTDSLPWDNIFCVNLIAHDLVTSGASSTSDRQLKNNICMLNDPFGLLKNIRGHTFEWRATGQRDYGVIADEVESDLPELVGKKLLNNKYDTVKYNGLIPVLIECIHELQSRLEKIEQ